MKDEIVHGNRKDEIFHGNKKNQIFHGNRKDEIVHGNMKDELVHGNKKNEIFHGNRKDKSHSNDADEVVSMYSVVARYKTLLRDPYLTKPLLLSPVT